MDLILWRHAEAHEAADGASDLDRPLTPKGERQAERVARWLNHVLPATTRILVSPAKRAQQTAHALERRFNTVEALAPDRSVQGLLEAARWADSRVPVLVVGHQPTLGLAAAQLLTGLDAGALPPWRIKKGAVWWIRSREDDEGGPPVALVTVRSPEML